MAAIPANGESQPFSWFVFGLMASVTFVGILSELVPSGILPQMTDGLGVSETQVGFLVVVYGWPPPLRHSIGQRDPARQPQDVADGAADRFRGVQYRRRLTSSYALIVACRILGGIAPA